MKENRMFLGLDSSTQSLKGTLIDEELNVALEHAVNFDADLPEFKTTGGVHRHPDGMTVTSPALMWVAALDLLLDRMRGAGAEFEKVAAISGSGQQHGSVWLKKGTRKIFRNLAPEKPLRDQMAGAFSVENSPVWMDSSTGKQCAEREKALGGAQAVAELTGSRAYERFTGNQIAKIFQTRPDAYAMTERICLVSSFVASLLIGDYAPIDTADGSGMNLMDIRSRKWTAAALACTAPDLDEKLGGIVASHCVAGRIHSYYTKKFAFPPDCLIIAFSGDNPNSLAGLRLERPGDIAVSLGTSDTVFGALSHPTPSGSEGHIFVNPVDPNAYMAMMCHKNGSLTREYARDEFTDGSWAGFGSTLLRTPPGNNGNIGFYIREPEITPPIMRVGITRFNRNDEKVERFPPDADVRAVVEGQALSMRLHSGKIGLAPKSVQATGGASANKRILQVISDVFGLPISVARQTASAALGAAYRALHGWRCERQGKFLPFAVVLARAGASDIVVRPDTAAHHVYADMMGRYERLEQLVMNG